MQKSFFIEAEEKIYPNDNRLKTYLNTEKTIFKLLVLVIESARIFSLVKYLKRFLVVHIYPFN